ncbi:MAG: methyltransferase domain-containing protein [Oligoflexia bacterium]|nr:methyltransferase domain-containing protein [Oligoflexia bacterium]
MRLPQFLHSDRLPRPPLCGALGPIRQRLVGRLLEREEPAIRQIAALWTTDRPAARDQLSTLVDSLVPELRDLVWTQARKGTAVERLAGMVDQRLHRQGQEYMDDPDIDVGVRTRIVADLERANGIIGSYERVLDVAGDWLSGPGPVSVLDIASGHGGLPIWLAGVARDRGLNLVVTASDLQLDYLAMAQASARKQGVHVHTRVLDALAMDLSPGQVDVVTCTFALHHFSPGQVAILLAEAVRVARRGVIFMDGLRCVSELVGAAGIFRAIGAPPHSLHDAVVSVRRFFATEELALMVGCAPGGQRARTFYVAPAWSAVRAPGGASGEASG